MARLVTEWVNVAGDISIIARESGEVWFHTPSGTKEDVDPFAAPMTGVGSAGSTVGLLDGAINLGFAGIEKRLARPDPTLVGYIVALVGAYHTSVDTPRNLRRAAGRFNELGRPEVAAYLEERAREETGHDRLALKDLRALGVPASDSSLALSRRASSRSASASMISASRTIQSAASAIRTAWSASPRSSRRPISRRCRRSVRMTLMRPASSEVTAPSEARPLTSKKRSSSSPPFPRMIVSESFRRRMNRH